LERRSVELRPERGVADATAYDPNAVDRVDRPWVHRDHDPPRADRFPDDDRPASRRGAEVEHVGSRSRELETVEKVGQLERGTRAKTLPLGGPIVRIAPSLVEEPSRHPPPTAKAST